MVKKIVVAQYGEDAKQTPKRANVTYSPTKHRWDPNSVVDISPVLHLYLYLYLSR